jgi:agmatine/peptidylarginine deiminase
MTEEVLKSIYGCKNVKFMPYTSGIGDVDEVLKPLSDKRMLTTEASYKPILEAMGYTVIMLPKHEDSYRTYANALIVGKKVFMPAFDESSDDAAAKVYSGLGYEVTKITSNYLSDVLLGSVHCQTMAYPRMPEQQLLNALGVEKVQ